MIEVPSPMNQPERSLMASFIVGQRELARLLGDSIEETGLSALGAVALRAVTLNPSVTVGAIGRLLAVRASTASYLVDRVVDAIELLAWRDRRRPLRQW